MHLVSLQGEYHMLGSFSYASPEGEILGNYASGKSVIKWIISLKG